jgi:1-acyl-sn-glycerol-3-phosphate acyltransferase
MGLFTWIAIIALFFYLTPFTRLVTRPVRALMKERNEWKFPFPPILVKIGRWEYLLGLFRDRVLSVLLLAYVVYYWITESPLSRDTLIASSLIVFYNLLAIVTIRYRDGIRLRLAELARVHSNIHPEDFFNLFYAMLSPWPPPFAEQGFRTVEYHEADYRTGQAYAHTPRPLIEAVLSTNTLARMAIIAFKRVGPDHGRDAFDGLARLWGSRVAQLFRARLHTTFREPIPPLEGKTILIYNHKSMLDFGLNFFALGDVRVLAQMRLGPGTRHLRPRFIAAKDHFIDNPFIYSWVGLGKVIENAGMIFINRRQKGRGWLAMAEAAEKLVTSDVEIAVYPQGTRAYPLHSSTGERLDAGFYTTFSKKTWEDPLGHLKPGTAHLILDTLLQLRKRGEPHLNVLVTSIMDAGIALRKGNWFVQTECDIEYRVAPLWQIPASFADGAARPATQEPQTPEEEVFFKKVQEIQQGINDRMVTLMDWHRQLREHALTEMKHLEFSQAERERLVGFLQEADRRADARPYILLDRIFSLKPLLWSRFLKLYLSLKDPELGNPAWNALLQEVSEKLKRYWINPRSEPL